MLVLVTYDLKHPAQEYPQLHDALKRMKAVRAWESAWFVKSPDAPSAIRDRLAELCAPRDSLFVGEIGDWAAWNVRISDWLAR